MPSKLEAFGQTAIEAGSCNIPTVTFKDTGLDNAIIHKKTGYLCQKITLSIYKIIFWSLKNIKKLKRMTRNEIKKNFSYKVISNKYKKIYLNSLNETN